MAEVTKRRARRVAQWLEQQRTERIARARPMRPQRGWFYGPYPGDPPEPEGGAGVREPRRPLPTAPAGAIELDLPRET